MNKAAELIAALFMAREQAHRAHLATTSYAQHMALGDFYDAIVDKADTFAEVYQGIYGIIEDIPYAKPTKGEVDDALETHLETVEGLRGAFTKLADKPLQNIIDDICAEFNRTLYKLRNLK